MTLNVGQGFKQRWLDAPEALRQGMLDELYRVCDLLTSDLTVEQWNDHDQRAMQIAQLSIEQAYATQKADLIETARVHKQQKLEQSLAKKRSQQQHYAEQLQYDEVKQFQQQSQDLKAIAEQVAEDSLRYSARYQFNKIPTTSYSAPLNQSTQQRVIEEIETIRLRLELEAETLIEDAFNAFKDKLKSAVQEEIEFIRAKSQS